jgi:hypothetical protein
LLESVNRTRQQERGQDREGERELSRHGRSVTPTRLFLAAVRPHLRGTYPSADACRN